jgi:hypothetical protein
MPKHRPEAVLIESRLRRLRITLPGAASRGIAETASRPS